jgi:ELWxxDGT repeat protein
MVDTREEARRAEPSRGGAGRDFLSRRKRRWAASCIDRNGTAAGTGRVKDTRPGTASSSPDQLSAARSRPFFVADDGVNGVELWRSDRTEIGTTLVRDIRPGAALGASMEGSRPSGSESRLLRERRRRGCFGTATAGRRGRRSRRRSYPARIPRSWRRRVHCVR